MGNYRKGGRVRNMKKRKLITLETRTMTDTNHVLKDTSYVPYRSFLAVIIVRSAAANGTHDYHHLHSYILCPISVSTPMK